MSTRTLLAIIILGLLTVSMASGGGSTSVLVDARGVYLHTNNDTTGSILPADPTIVDLAANGFTSGAGIRISFNIPDPGYAYRCPDLSGPTPLLKTEDFTFGTDDFPLGVGADLLGVLSASDDLKTPDFAARVTGAIDAGTDIVTLNSFRGDQPTDIPQDFQIFPHTDFCVEVPSVATHLFLGVGDSFFSDNCVPGNFFITADHPRGAIEVTIESSVKGLIAGAIQELSATQEAIEADPSGVGDPERAIKSLDKAITRLESSLLSFPEGDPCRLLGEDCKVGKKFFKVLERAVEVIFEAIDDGGISDSDILADLESIVVGQILEAANIVATTAIEDATAASGDPKNIFQAEFHFDTAEQHTADGVTASIAALMFFDEAVGSYKQAWRKARRAVGAC